MRQFIVGAAFACGLAFAGIANAGEVGVGIGAHDVDLWKQECCFESGQNLEVHYRSDPLKVDRGLGIWRLWALGSVNSDGGTNFVAGGIQRRFWEDKKVYAQLSVGLGVHDGPDEDYQKTPDRIYFGSPVLIASEAAAGVNLNDNWSGEVAYFHMSHAGLAGDQNPGLDVVSVRLIRKF
ncbi:MAG: acyloxyacyl hydrolase [Caulobacteraceae bacterium]|nr:MAG: acyloxyacyl hydrolase [Caulobacteraceae bacterium]